MSLNEMKESAKQLTAAELEELVLHLEFLQQCADPAFREEMLRRATVTERWYSGEEVKASRESRTAGGL